MAVSGDLIDFEVIESHKENIQALPSGRSAKALAQLYSPSLTLGQTPSPALTSDAHNKERAKFEKELQSVDEADDPLDIFDRYVKWTLDAYPSAQATPQSQLLPLLERATKTFQAEKHYKNDARYLKLWLHYIRLFSDAPRETFVYLARHGIGETLALYYEEFAAWLENAGRWNQAEEIYKMGIEKEATPQARLMRKFGEFEQRKAARAEDADEPSSPAMPSVRPALAARVDPFAAASPAASQQQPKSSTSKKPKSSKMQIFSDAEAPESRPSSGSSGQGWDSIGSLADRRKENTPEAKPWSGEKLQTGKTNGGMGKMMVFKDESRSILHLPYHLTNRRSGDSNHEEQTVRNPKTGRLECVFVDLASIYPAERGRPEYCFEELIARRRGWMSRSWRREQNVKSYNKKQNVRANDIQQDEAMTVNRDFHEQEQTPHSIDLPPLQQAHSSREDDLPNLLNSADDTAETDPLAHEDIEHDEGLPEHNSMPKDFDTQSEKSRRQPRSRKGGFQIFEDADLAARDCSPPLKETHVRVETHVRTLPVKDENDENSPPTQQEVELAKQLRREARQNRTRKIRVMDVKHVHNETKTIQINMDSPVKTNKMKRKKSAEPTMTINTREAMDEVYDLFNQPLESHAETDADSDEDSEEEYTTDAESTGTGKISGAGSEYGDETRNEILQSSQDQPHPNDEDDQTDATGWSEYTTSKHLPREESSVADETYSTSGLQVYQESEHDEIPLPDEELITPVDENPRTTFVPIPPEGYEAPAGQYRDAAIVANNRLPFMTPIVEQTESSIGAATSRTDSSYFQQQTKTPSRKAGEPVQALIELDEPCSSPFQDDGIDLAAVKRKVLMPIRTKSTKGTISLGQGTAKSQIDAKANDALITAVADEPFSKGPAIKDFQCNPMDPHIRQTILGSLKPSLATYDGYYEDLDLSSGKTAEIRKYISKMSKKARETGDKTAATLSLPPMLNLPGSDCTYTIRRELGAGTFAPVYLVENSTATSSEEDEEERPPSRGMGKLAYRKRLEAMKMEDPPSTWEFYILRQAHRRLGVSRASESIVRAHEMHLFRDECFLVEEYRDQGTLLDLVNLARVDSGSSGGMEEALAMFFTIELLRTVDAMHSRHLIHGDLKADNVLVRFDDPGMETDWSPTYFPSGAHGWSSKGVCLIDFGRGIDMKQFAPSVGFIADWKTTDADCAEMRELRPWTYQIDYHGLAGIVHTCLFGKYMETVAERGAALGQGATKTYRIKESLKRYWQTEIWSELFALLLNPLAHLDAEEGGKMPIVRGLRAVRERMETWLEENCERGVGLKAMIVRMDALTKERRRKSAR